MHELSIATYIIEIAEEFAHDHGSEKISKLELEIGLLSGVDYESLRFALDLATKNTVLENSEIILNQVAGRSKCNQCQHIFNISNLYTHCPVCSSSNFEIIEGKELKISSIFTT